MEKSVFTQEYLVFLAELRKARQDAGLRQDEVAEQLGETQSWVSKCERGERRLDLVELRAFCRVFGIQLADFVQRVDDAMGELPVASTPQR